MWTYLLGPILALLPERWRKRLFPDAPVEWGRAGFLSGVFEGMGCLLALIGWYLYFLNRAVQQQMDVTMQATKGVPAEGAAFGMGAAALAAFVLHPVTWALAYFWIEGTLRALAAWTGEEVAGTLPLVAVDALARRLSRRAYESRVPLVADEVTAGKEEDPWDLKVESCRPKPTWKFPLTVRFREAYFQIMEGRPGTPARPHVYLLRRPRAGEVYRGVVDYDPEDILRTEEQPHFLRDVAGAVREKYRLSQIPLVEDTVLRGDGGEGWHLKVESCRPKAMWAPPRTIRFEDQLYTVEGSYEAALPRPFGYTLHELRPHEAARGTLNYSPDDVLRENP